LAVQDFSPKFVEGLSRAHATGSKGSVCCAEKRDKSREDGIGGG